MSLAALSGATTIAFASTILFLLIVKSWHVLAQSVGAKTRFPNSIMLEAAQRFRDDLERLGREQSLFLIAALVFSVIFAINYLLSPLAMFEDLPQWQLLLVLVLFAAAALYTAYRLINIVIAKRRLVFIRDANMATGHALQKLTANQNRVFHDVRCGAGIIDNVVVGRHGIYTISVIARKPGKINTVSLHGDKLTFAPGDVSLSVARSGEKSGQLAKEIGKLLKHNVRVRSVVVVPGWEVDSQTSEAYLIVNERNLAMLSGWKDQNDYLMNEDVDLVQKMLTRRCTRFRK
ncbi:MAG: NERD domain-containing protein [Proteobacteria bacterium]|nr:NERD domain-containing protein [Pseudomonadota bacterium]